MRVALIGDSHSQLHFNSLGDLVANAGGDVVYKTSQAGWGVNSFLDSDLMAGLQEVQPDAAIVALGGNNQDLSDTYGDTLQAFIDGLRETGISKIIWLGPFESDWNTQFSTATRHEWTADFQKKFFRWKRVVWVDMRPVSKEREWRDGVHFSSAVYDAMIEEVAPVIARALLFPIVFSKPAYLWSALGVVVMIGTGFLTHEYYSDDVRRIGP